MSPRARTVFLLAMLAVAGLVLAAAIVFATLDRLRVRAAESNTDFVLTQLRDAVETSISLGLALPEIRVAQDLIERERAGSPDILAIEIFNPAGISVFNTDRGSVGEPITQAWQEAIRRRSTDGRWRIEEFGAIVVGESVRNDFGEAIGEIAVTLSGTAREAHADGVAETLVPWLAAIAIAGFGLVAVVATLVLRAGGRDLARAAEVLGADRPPPETSSPDSDDVVTTAIAMRASIEQMTTRVEAAAAAVRRIDEDEERDAAA